MNRPPKETPFVWFTDEMLASQAWRALSGNGQMVVTRLCLEHMGHAATRNGSLVCTYDDFHAYGIRRPSIANAIREAEFFGFIRVSKGRAFKGHREPSLYRLTWLPNEKNEYATNDWKAIKAAHVTAFKAERTESNRLKKAAKERRKSIALAGEENAVIPFRLHRGAN